MKKKITRQVFNEVQRLSGLDLTRKEIATAVGCGISTVGAIRTAGNWENYEDLKKIRREGKYKKANSENQDSYAERDFLRKLHNCEKCKEFGNNGCGSIMFEELFADGDCVDGAFYCEGFQKRSEWKETWIEIGPNSGIAIQCPDCGLYIPCDDYEKAKETHKFCYKCGKKMF